MSKTPKLRFKEFSGDWEKKKLGDITTLMQSGLSRKLSDKDIGVPVIRSNNLIDGKIDTFDMKYWYKIDDQGVKLEKYFLKKDDLLVNFINSLAQIGKCSVYTDELQRDTIFTTNIMRLNFKEYINTNYIFNYFQLKKYSEYIQSITKPAVNQASFTTVDFKRFKINIPSIEEQEKIASFFSLIDKKISLQGEKVEALKDYKKGMMQKIFSRELRFKDDDGRDYLEWEEKKLGELFNIKAGGDIKSENVSKEMTDKKIYPVYANALTNKGLYGYTDTFKVEGNTITVTGRGDIGYAIARNNKYYPIVRLLVLSPIEKLDTLFFENIINFTNIFIESTGVPQLTSPQLSQVKVRVPVFEEQNKIAKLLKGIDNKIEKEQEKLDSLNEYKKGLLQQMFV